MLRKTLLALLLAGMSALAADTLVLSNGDRLTGTVLSQDDGVIIFHSDLLGRLTVPAKDATVDAAAPALTAEDAAVEAEAIATDTTSDEAEAATEETDAFTDAIAGAESWMKENIVPEGWSGKLSFGFSFIETDTETTAITFDFNGKKDAAPHHYMFDVYYNYKNEQQTNGTSNKQLDKWGASIGYNYDITKRLYFLSEIDYLRDMVKNIRHESNLDLGIGYRIIDEEDMKLSIAPAYTLQYKDAEGVEQKWYHLATLKQDFSYNFNSMFRFEENASGGIAPANTEDYNYKLKAALIAKLNEWIEASLSYQLSYDNTVGSGGTKKEQQIIFALGVPY